MFPWYLVFLKRSLVFPILLFSCIFFFFFLYSSFKKDFLSLLTILWNSAFNWVYLSLPPLPFAFLLSSAICKASSDHHFASWVSFSLEWFWSLPLVQCYEPPSIFLQAFCLSDLIHWIYLSPPLYDHKGFDLGHKGFDLGPKESLCNAGDPYLIPGLGRSAVEGIGYPLHILAWRIPWTV